MDSVFLMVGRANEGVHDLEIMPDVPAAELADAIALAFGWPGTYDIQFAGQILPANQTLADAGIWDGSYLILVASNRPSHPISGINRPLQVADRTGQCMISPLVGKRALQVPNASQEDASISSATTCQPVPPDVPASKSNPTPVIGWHQPTIPTEPFSTDQDQQP